MRIALLAAALLPAPVAAQDNTPIVVIGQRDIEQQIESFVGALTKTSPRGQIGRFETAVCPAAFGMADAQRAAVRDRIRAVAQGVGLDVGAADCTPNLLVVVAGDKTAFIKALGKDHNYMFGDRTPAQVRKIVAEPGPATAWQVQTIVNADGRPIMNEGDLAINRSTRNPSRIAPPARPTFVAAVVVIEGAALEGLTTTQLADYAAMRTLARIEPARIDAAAPATILRILDAAADSEVPVTLTQWDFSFLKGLYSIPNNLYAPSQRSEIGRAMEQELDRSDGGGAPRPGAARLGEGMTTDDGKR
ncbi:hypothetical protein [Sphingopyxis sp.]|jgi:hypothetical protein|uniref:hypothetical protein n=1 Tax=Sphingopyxis sp. TaxID=1908224 RepID=UPI003F71A2B4